MINDYCLEIVSRDKRYDGKVFKPYNIDGKTTIGVSKKEPFEIRFRNNSWNRVQVRFSMDGTDILTGEPATTDPTGKMWLVEGHASMTLKAWPESNSGGARFVFGESGKSVAVNTHGNVEGLGVIAAAVFVEGVRNVRISKYKKSAGCEINTSCEISTRRCSTKGFDSRSRNVSRGMNYSNDCCDFDLERCCGAAAYEPAPAIGAGEYVAQSLSKAAGLDKPKLAQTLEVHYKWWNEVRESLTKFGSLRDDDSPNPFPGDDDQHIDLSYTPRQNSTARKPYCTPYCTWAQYL